MKNPSHLIVSQSHLAPLEGLRGVVALMVVSFHFSKLFFGENWTPFGYLGVDFFFVLSGFIIARQYEAAVATRSIDLKFFAIRRLARLYPLYIVTIAAALIINATLVPVDSPLHLSNFGYGPNFIAWMIAQLTMLGGITQMVQPNGPSWSISVEWVVNLLFFGLVWHYRSVPKLLLWVIAGVGSWYLLSITPDSLETPTHSVPLVRGVVGFTLGWLIFRYHLLLPKLPLLLLYLFEMSLLAAFLAAAVWHKELLPYGGDFLFQLLLIPAFVMASLYRYGLIGFCFSRLLIRFLGRISYSIYLLHYPLTYVVVHTPSLLAMGAPWVGISYVAMLMSFATLSYLLIEKPGRWLGRKLTARAA